MSYLSKVPVFLESKSGAFFIVNSDQFYGSEAVKKLTSFGWLSLKIALSKLQLSKTVE
jgi:hypothetical protein